MSISSIGSFSSSPLPISIAAKPSSVQKADIKPVLNAFKFELPTQDSLKQEMENFSSRAGKLFQDAGIQFPPEPVLQSDFDGNIRVASNHPDKSKIEQIFKDNPELQKNFIKISSDTTTLRAAEHYSEFANEYSRLYCNPSAQNSLVESEIARNNAPFYMVLGVNGAESFFGLTGVEV
jgi:hypothetical protein